MFTIIYLLEAMAFTMTMNKNKSDQKKEKRSKIYQKTTHKEHQKLREKFKIEKIIDSLANPLLYCREKKKKTSQPLCTISLKISFSFVAPTHATLIMVHIL